LLGIYELFDSSWLSTLSQKSKIKPVFQEKMAQVAGPLLDLYHYMKKKWIVVHFPDWVLVVVNANDNHQQRSEGWNHHMKLKADGKISWMSYIDTMTGHHWRSKRYSTYIYSGSNCEYVSLTYFCHNKSEIIVYFSYMNARSLVRDKKLIVKKIGRIREFHEIFNIVYLILNLCAVGKDCAWSKLLDILWYKKEC
jgi:hypothetical protein